MTVQEKIDNDYYHQKGVSLYDQFIKNGSRDLVTGEETPCTIYAEFRKDCFEEFGIADHPKANDFFEHCWFDGHDCSIYLAGLQRTWNVFKRWVDILK
jgi:hypothetical protein